MGQKLKLFFTVILLLLKEASRSATGLMVGISVIIYEVKYTAAELASDDDNLTDLDTPKQQR